MGVPIRRDSHVCLIEIYELCPLTSGRECKIMVTILQLSPSPLMQECASSPSEGRGEQRRGRGAPRPYKLI